MLGDFFLRFRGGEVPDPDETLRLTTRGPDPHSMVIILLESD